MHMQQGGGAGTKRGEKNEKLEEPGKRIFQAFMGRPALISN